MLVLPAVLSGQDEKIPDNVTAISEEPDQPIDKKIPDDETVDAEVTPKEEIKKQPEEKTATENKNDTAESTKKDTAAAEKTNDENVGTEAVKSKIRNSASNSETSNIVKKPSFQNTSRYIEIEDGNFKYERIPGITLKKHIFIETITDETVQASKQKEIKIDKTEKENIEGKEQKKGFFGLLSKFSDIVKIIVIFIVMILIFLIFRLRSKSRAGKVLRRFPGS